MLRRVNALRASSASLRPSVFDVITGFGTSTANLRALGSANTLVLINGRRVAGRAGDEEGFANLLNVPLAAIERVDVQLDGGSAVYGADAIGGVISSLPRRTTRVLP